MKKTKIYFVESHLDRLILNPVYPAIERPADKKFPLGLESIKYPGNTTFRNEKFYERFGDCVTVVITEELGITGQAPQKLKISNSFELITQCNMIQKYYQPIKTPQNDCAIVYTDRNNTILHMGHVTDINTNNPILPRCKSKWGTEPRITAHDLFNITNIYGDFAYFFTLKNEFLTNKNLLLTSLQNDINQSDTIKIQLSLANKALICLAKGEDVTSFGDDGFNEQDSPAKKTYHLIHTCMGLNIDIVDQSEKTPLMHAIQRGDDNMIYLLLKIGANANKQDSNGDTALHFATQQQNNEAATLLFKYGAADETIQNNQKEKPNLNEKLQALANVKYSLLILAAKEALSMDDEAMNSMTPIEQAAYFLTTYKKVIKIDFQERKNGATALIVAVQYNNIEMAKLLLAHGANTQIKDKEGHTAYDWANHFGYTELKNLLAPKNTVSVTPPPTIEPPKKDDNQLTIDNVAKIIGTGTIAIIGSIVLYKLFCAAKI